MLNQGLVENLVNVVADSGRKKVGHMPLKSATSAPSVSTDTELISEYVPIFEGLPGNNKTGRGMRIVSEYVGGIDELWPKGKTEVEPWHDEVVKALWRRNFHNGNVIAIVEDAGNTLAFKNAFHMLRMVCGSKHPSEVTIFDIYDFFDSRPDIATGTRRHYQRQIKQMFTGMRNLGIIPLTCTPDLDIKLEKAKRGQPRPLSMEMVTNLITNAKEPYNYWFALGCFAGMRASEIAMIRGEDLETDALGNYCIRIPNGKGGTNLTVPCTDYLREMILSFNTKGRLWVVTPLYLSKLAGAEMVRLGVKEKGRDSRGISFHSSRHYYATMMLAASKSVTGQKDWDLVRQVMRHKDISTTQIYAYSDNSEVNNVAENAFSRFNFGH